MVDGGWLDGWMVAWLDGWMVDKIFLVCFFVLKDLFLV